MDLRRGSRGFTLIELMIALAVVAILAAIVYPSYLDGVVRSRRAQAQVLLSDIAQRQQQYLMDNHGFAATTTALGVAVPPEVAALYDVRITVATTTPAAYTATATPLTGTTQAGDGTLSINSEGGKLPTGKW